MTKGDLTVERKFRENGEAIPYRGNTIISFTNQRDTQIYQLADEIQKDMRKYSFCSCLAILPLSSLHMTVLTLCREIDRGTQYWPQGITEDESFHMIDRILKKRIECVEGFEGIWMKIDYFDGNKLVLYSCDEHMERMLRTYRDQVSTIAGIRHPGHETFRFHISLSYTVREMSRSQKEEYREFCEKWTEIAKEKIDRFLVPRPRFVIFNDMLAYETDLGKRK